MINSNSIKVIAMDYDGTIVKSNDIKDEAFESILNDWPLYKDKMISWHKKKG